MQKNSGRLLVVFIPSKTLYLQGFQIPFLIKTQNMGAGLEI